MSFYFLCFFVWLINLFAISVPLSLSLSCRDCTPIVTPLSLIYVRKPVVVARTQPLVRPRHPHNVGFANSRAPTDRPYVSSARLSARVRFTTLFLGFDCEINLGLARNTEQRAPLACAWSVRLVRSRWPKRNREEEQGERERESGRSVLAVSATSSFVVI